MSDDDIEMVDQLDSSQSESKVMSVTDQTDNAELDAATRIENLCALDEEITCVLTRAAAIVEALAQGKLPGGGEAKKEQFSSALQEYNQLVESVNGKLRYEVKKLHEASHSKLLPLYIPVQASSLGEEKEDMLFASLDKQSRD